MAIGEAMSAARKRKGMSQQNLSKECNYSRESIAKYETGSRKLPREMYATVTQKIDDPEFYFDTWGETTGFVSIPYFNGENIDRHPSSMVFLVKQEIEEAMERLDEVCWAKPVRAYADSERQQLTTTLHEGLDAAASLVNMVACICEYHEISMKDLFRSWHVSLKSRKYKL
jgi:transcriptional regulator with XRE-family HTH domain